jgi:uncharacterized protein YyaL (SSP411 family)
MVRGLVVLLLLVLGGVPPAALASTGEGATTAELQHIPTELPGATPFGDALRQRLASELAARPEDYKPRTRHLRPDGSPLYSNRLLFETSPYLQQHAHNPVDWHAWGDEAFEKARRLNRPVLVSIGYSTCHWCHVMEEESFDDADTARELNRRYVAIKVDREARPDIDAIYMAAIHVMQGRGGWPLNVWLTPDRKPFFGGTYFPPTAKGRRPGFVEVLKQVADEYAQNPEKISQISDRVTTAIKQNLEGSAPQTSSVPNAAILTRAMTGIAAVADRTWGGSGSRTKFPSTIPIRFLLRHYQTTGNADALEIATLSLDKMAAGGMYDHVGGGFHRYSTDRTWLVPHFEKMLYDNALLAVAYAEAGQATGRSEYSQIARSVLDYVTREMTASGGGFYSATDADSLSPGGESEEGWFFTWTPAEIEASVGKDLARVINNYYGVTERGNYEGRNILHAWRTPEAVANALNMKPTAVTAAVEQAKHMLYATRAKRTPPLRDDKILVAWNGLMISAFARVGFLLDEPRYIEAATGAADFILNRMREDGRLVRVFQNDRATGPAFLEDYAFLIAGVLDLYEADGRQYWLESAIALQAVLDTHYADTKAGAYFQTADDHEPLLAREKPSDDGAIPAGNSVAVLNLMRLAELTGNPLYTTTSGHLISNFQRALSEHPERLSEMLIAVDFFLAPRVEIVLVSPPDGGGLDAMLAPLRATFHPNRVLTVVPQNAALAGHAVVNPLLRDRGTRDGKATVYLCRDRVCSYPTSDPNEFAKQLKSLRDVTP